MGNRLQRCFYGDMNTNVDNAVNTKDAAIGRLAGLDTQNRNLIRQAEHDITQSNDEIANDRLRRDIELLQRGCERIRREIAILQEEKDGIRGLKREKPFDDAYKTMRKRGIKKGRSISEKIKLLKNKQENPETKKSL